MCIAPLFSYSGFALPSNPQRKQIETATAAKCCRHCGQSRHCDHMHEWRRIATAVDSAQLGFEDRRPSLAQLWSVWGAPTSLHQREPRLRPSQTKSSSPSARPFPGMPGLTVMRRLLRWARIPNPDKKLVNSLRPPIQGCFFLLQQREGVSEGAFIFFWQLRHSGQGAEAFLCAAPAREELAIPFGGVPHAWPADAREKPKHHQVRGVHGNVPRIPGPKIAATAKEALWHKRESMVWRSQNTNL